MPSYVRGSPASNLQLTSCCTSEQHLGHFELHVAQITLLNHSWQLLLVHCVHRTLSRCLPYGNCSSSSTAASEGVQPILLISVKTLLAVIGQ